MEFLKGVGLIGAVVLAGCASTPQYVESDFTHTVIEDYGVIGVKSSSERSGKAFWIYGVCADGEREYVIRQTSTSIFGSDGRWVTQSGNGSLSSTLTFTDRDAFLKSLSSLEVMKRPEGFTGEQRMKVAAQSEFKIPDLCEAKQAKNDAIASRQAEAEAAKNISLIKEVVDRTGVQPMLTGRNERDFNDLVAMFRRLGIEGFVGKFVWAQDGDYFVSQILRGEVVLTSLTNPALFPPISIMTDKQALEGQPWSAVSRGPLQFVGPKQYKTVLGVERQLLVFKSI
jgi:hypothetical protein